MICLQIGMWLSGEMSVRFATLIFSLFLSLQLSLLHFEECCWEFQEYQWGQMKALCKGGRWRLITSNDSMWLVLFSVSVWVCVSSWQNVVLKTATVEGTATGSGRFDRWQSAGETFQINLLDWDHWAMPGTKWKCFECHLRDLRISLRTCWETVQGR